MSRGPDAHREVQLLASMVPELVFVTEPGGRMLWANEALMAKTGFTVEDFQFENPDNPFIHPDDLPRVGAFLAEFAGSDDPISSPIENRFMDKWGRTLAYRSVVTKLTWDGIPAFMVVAEAVIADGDEARRDSEARYRSLVDNVNDGIVRLTPEGGLRYSNPRFWEMLGVEPTRLRDRSFLDLVTGDDRERVKRILTVDAATEPLRFECKLCRGDGTVIDSDVNAVRLGEGVDAGLWQAVIRDVTEARRLEGELRHAQKLESLGVLSSGIAHDLNNILTGILGNATLAKELVEPDSLLADVVDEIRGSCERAASLTLSMLAYAGQAPTRRRATDIAEVVAGMQQLIRAAIPRTTRLEIESPPHPVWAHGDPAQVGQVVMNLIMNAAEAGGEAGCTVRVTAGVGEQRPGAQWVQTYPGPVPEGRHVFVRVSDDGPGMDGETVSRMFDPFFTTKAKGRGLGLSAVLGIVRDHGGTLCLDTSEGRGTTFEVLLPPAMTPTKERGNEVRVGSADSTRGATVLFVDDEAAIRRLAERTLERAGFTVTTAEDGADAVDLVAADPQRFSVVVLDHDMPRLRGDLAAKRVLELSPRTPVVRISGYVEPSSRIDLPELPLLAKPYTARQLVEVVRSAATRASVPASTR